MNVALRHGLGDVFEDYWDYVSTPPPVTGSGEGGYEGGGLPGGIPDYSSGESGDTTTLNFGGGYVGSTTPGGGYATVKPVQGSTGIDAAALAKALTAGTLLVSKLNPATGQAACSSGYQYPNGSCLPVATPAAKQILAGVSNQTLAIVGIGFLLLMMMGGKHR